jgi:hypothetical protein
MKKDKEFHGANLRTLICTGISQAISDGLDMQNYKHRNWVIDKIEERLQSDEFTAVCTSNGTTFEKTFTPKKNE